LGTSKSNGSRLSGGEKRASGSIVCEIGAERTQGKQTGCLEGRKSIDEECVPKKRITGLNVWKPIEERVRAALPGAAQGQRQGKATPIPKGLCSKTGLAFVKRMARKKSSRWVGAGK